MALSKEDLNVTLLGPVVDYMALVQELLEQLKSSVDMMDRARSILQHQDGGPEPAWAHNWGMLDTTDARAAIAKAEGRES